MHVINARGQDLRFVLQQQAAESNALGFVPRPRLEWEISRGRVMLAFEGKLPLGYCYLGSTASGVLPIYQCVTERGVRRHAIGAALVQAAERAAAVGGAWGVELKCRADLQANLFWRALGFTQSEVRRGGRGRGQLLFTWERRF